MFSKTNEGGVFHPLMALAVVAVLAVVGFAGWKVMDKNKDGNSGTPAANRAVEDECNKELDDKDLCKFAANYSADVSFKSTINLTDKDGAKSVMVLETDGNNTSMTTSQDDKEVTATVYLNGDSYVKNVATGKWTKYPKNPDGPAENTNPASDIEIRSENFKKGSKVTYKAMGKEACGSLNCFKYQVVDSENPETEQFIWFDDKDYKLRRWTSNDTTGSSDMVFSYQAANITVPSPVEESSSGTSAAEIQAALEAARQAAEAYSN